MLDREVVERRLAALNVRFDSDAGEEMTVREYLRALLFTLWNEGESFSGKRPFGNSGWEYDLYAPLVRAGFIDGTLDDDGFLAEISDEEVAADFVRDLIETAFDENAIRLVRDGDSGEGE